MSKEFINPASLSAPTGYSHVAVVQGRQAHIAGQIAMNASGQVIGKGDLTAQAEQVFSNLAAAVEAAGGNLKSIFKIVTFVVDLTPEKAKEIRLVRAKYFGEEPYPAGSMVGVTSLVHPDLLLEIEAIADLG